jgi:hypothetical protein
MRRFRFRRLAVLFSPMLLVAGCASGSPHDVQELGDRMQIQLAPEIADGRVGLQRLPDGAQVTLTDRALFPNGSATLDSRGRYVLASVIEGLLAPPLLQIDVTEAPGTPPSLQQARALAVTQYLREYEVAPELQYATLQQGMPAAGGTVAGDAAAPGTAITVTLIARHSG